jgi:hypothetical protein
MSTSASLHADEAPGMVLEERKQLAAAKLPPHKDQTVSSTPWIWKTLFARSIPTVASSDMDRSFASGNDTETMPEYAGGRRSHPHHQSRPNPKREATGPWKTIG